MDSRMLSEYLHLAHMPPGRWQTVECARGSGCYRRSLRSAVRFAVALLVVACIHGPSMDVIESGGDRSVTRTAGANAEPAVARGGEAPAVVRRRLHFGTVGRAGRTVARLPYGSRASRLGYSPVCLKGNCPPPCPCEVQQQPSSFDVDPDGRLAVLDVAKARVALFDDGRFVKAVALPNKDYGGEDLQTVGRTVTVLSSREMRFYLTHLRPGVKRARVIKYQGAPVETVSRIATDGERPYATIWGPLSESEVPVRLVAGRRRPAVVARRVPGRPFLDGWMPFHPYVAEDTIRLSTEASSSWSRDIRFGFYRDSGGLRRKVRGSVTWELEVSRAGTTHLLIAASTEARGPFINGYWYLRVERDGKVGRAVPLEGPTGPDDQQYRRLTLDEADQPLVMWSGRRGVRIESLARLTSWPPRPCCRETYAQRTRSRAGRTGSMVLGQQDPVLSTQRRGDR